MIKKNIKKWLMLVGTNFVIFAMLFSLGMVTFFSGGKSIFTAYENDVFYSGNKQQKNVSLMINVYWGNEYIEEMLTILKKHQIKTTFFVGGVWVSKYPEIFLDIVDDGHEIGNHGFFHKNQDKLNYNQNQSEIFNTHKLVKEYSKIDMNLFAPPSGAFSDVTISVAKNLGYKTIMWSKDTIDWRDQNKDLILKRATTNLNGGDLILMHPTKATKNCLEDIIIKIKSQGFKIVTVSQNIYGDIV